MKTFIKLLLFTILCSGIFYCQSKIDKFNSKYGKYYVEKNLMIVLPTELTDKITFGYNNLIADILWLEFIQYYGDNSIIKRSGSKKYDFGYTYKYIDVITTIDPNFGYAYWFGAFAIADEMGRPDLAIKMLEKGIKSNPKNWWLPYTASIMELMYNNDFVAASKYIDDAARMKPNYPKVQLVKKVLESKAAKQEKARIIWLGIYKDAAKQGDNILMAKAVKKLRQLGYIINGL